MFSTGRRRIAWLLASTLWVACGGATTKVEAPRDTEDEADPDEFAISDEPDREIAEAEEKPAEPPVEETPADEAKVAEAEEPEEEEPPPPPKVKAKPKQVAAAAKKPKKKIVEPADDEEEEEPARERVNRKTMALHKKRGDTFDVGVGRRDREARMARDERARAKGKRSSAREREEEAEEEREERAEEARQAKEEREERARAAKEAKAEKLRAAKEAKAEKARKAKDAKAERLRIAQEAKAEKARKAAAAKKASEDDEDDEEPEEAPPPKKAAKAKVDENLIEMDGEEEEEERATSVASIEEDDPLAETPRIDRSDDQPEPVVVPAMPAINDRGLTVAQKQLEVHGRLGLQTLTLPGATAGTTVSSTSETLALGVAYGIGEKAEVGADYTLSINPGTVKGPLALHVAYAAKHTGKLDVAIAAGLAFDFIETSNAVTMMTISTSYASLQLGAWARYRATPKVSIFTGLPALPSAAPSLSKNSLALPPFSYQVQIGLNNQGTTAIEIPIGLGVQIKPNIYAFASLDFAHIRLANTAPAYIFSDFIPLSLGAFYTHKKLDIGVQLSDDLKKGADYLQLGTVLRYLVK